MNEYKYGSDGRIFERTPDGDFKVATGLKVGSKGLHYEKTSDGDFREAIIKPYEESLTWGQKARLGGQGWYSFGDEGEAAVRALLGKEHYTDAYKTEVKKIREDIAEARRIAPIESMAWEMAGGLTAPGGQMKTGGTALKTALNMVKTGAWQGAATGVGEAEDITNIPDVAFKTVAGAAGGAVVAPIVGGTMKGVGKAGKWGYNKTTGNTKANPDIETTNILSDHYDSLNLKEIYPGLSKAEAFNKYKNKIAHQQGLKLGEVDEWMQTHYVEAMKYPTIEGGETIKSIGDREALRTDEFPTRMSEAGIPSEGEVERINRIREFDKLKNEIPIDKSVKDLQNDLKTIESEFPNTIKMGYDQLERNLKNKQSESTNLKSEVETFKTNKNRFITGDSTENLEDTIGEFGFNQSQKLRNINENIRNPHEIHDPYAQDAMLGFIDTDTISPADKLVYGSPVYTRIAKDALAEAPQLPPQILTSGGKKVGSYKDDVKIDYQDVKKEWYDWFDNIIDTDDTFPISFLVRNDKQAFGAYMKWAQDNPGKTTPIDERNISESMQSNRKEWLNARRQRESDSIIIKNKLGLKIGEDLTVSHPRYNELSKQIPEHILDWESFKGGETGHETPGFPTNRGALEAAEWDFINGRTQEIPDVFEKRLERSDKSFAEYNKNLDNIKKRQKQDPKTIQERKSKYESKLKRLEEDASYSEVSAETYKTDLPGHKANLLTQAEEELKKDIQDIKISMDYKNKADELNRPRVRGVKATEAELNQMNKEFNRFKKSTVNDLVVMRKQYLTNPGGGVILDQFLFNITDKLTRELSGPTPTSAIQFINNPSTRGKLIALDEKKGNQIMDYLETESKKAITYRGSTKGGMGSLGMKEMPDDAPTIPGILGHIGISGAALSKGMPLTAASNLYRAGRALKEREKVKVFKKGKKAATGLLAKNKGLNTPLEDLTLPELRKILNEGNPDKALRNKILAIIINNSNFSNAGIQGAKSGFLSFIE